MQLSDHFSLEELVASELAARQGIDNTPSVEVENNLRVLAAGLERVRVVLAGAPIHVNSGYRCAALNAAVGGAANSAHVRGLAADIVCPGFGSPLDVCRAIAASGVPTDQIIHEFGAWCHVAFAALGGVPRGEFLTIRHGTGYQAGLLSVA